MTTDPDSKETFTYSLVKGEGDEDNAFFQIKGDLLVSNKIFDFETKKKRSIRIQTQSGKGTILSKKYIIDIVDLPELKPFITEWKTTKARERITIPTKGSGYDYSIDWGDGTVETAKTTGATHIYATAGVYTVKIARNFPRIYFNNAGDKDKIINIKSWGKIQWISLEAAFQGCKNLTSNASDKPNLTKVTNMSYAFAGTAINADIHLWDVSEVTTMNGVFDGAVKFNQDLSTWDVSKVRSMNSMFAGAINFNRNLSTWSVSEVANMGSMFADATNFNQDLSKWDMSKVTDMSHMFQKATSFNQPVSLWNVSKVVDMTGMFSSATGFDQSLANWDVSRVITMRDMLLGIALSVNNYDATLIAWSKKILQTGVSFNGGNSKFCRAETERENLKAVNAWKITDGGKDPSCVLSSTPFITTWKISSAGETITIPTIGAGYNYSIDWGDGTLDVGKTTAARHTYATPGSYTVKISGDFPQMYFNDSGDKDKIIEVNAWGDIKWRSMAKAFYGCSQLNIGTKKAPDLSGVTDMSDMLSGATSVDQDLSKWDVSQVTNMRDMLRGVTLSTPNYDALLTAWNRLIVKKNVPFNGGNSKFCKSEADRANLKTANLWTIIDGGKDPACGIKAFITEWEIISSGETITIPTEGSGYNYSVDWGDGVVAFGKTKNATHSYATPGTYTVTIFGDFPRIYFDNTGDKDKITDIKQWGDIEWGSMEKAFYGCSKLKITATDVPDLSKVTDMSFMLSNASSFNQDLRTWDVSKVRLMVSTFSGAVAFDQVLGYWEVSNVRNMTDMLKGVTLSTINYDETLIAWNTQTVQSGVVFDGGNSKFCRSETDRANLKSANTWTITDGGKDPLCGSRPFITEWETTTPGESITIPTDGGGYNYSVDWGDGTTTSGEINNATHTYATPGTHTVTISGDFPRIYFNNTGDKNKITKVTAWGDVAWSSMKKAFYGCSKLKITASDTPDLSSVTDMTDMFHGASAFNQDLSKWNVSSVTDMTDMFHGASAFNQDLSKWNVSSVTNMTDMFRAISHGSSAFNQDLSKWNVSKVIAMKDMFYGVTLSTANYDAILTAWSKVTPKNSVNFSGGNSKFCRSEVDRTKLKTTFGWSISDGGKDIACISGPKPFITEWKIRKNGDRIIIPTTGSGYNYTIDWGDGTKETGKTNNATHTYAKAGDYSVQISGAFPRIKLGDITVNPAMREQLIAITQWGDIQWTSMNAAFFACRNLQINAT